MKLKIVSLFLFVLFCVVVLFPGYGRVRYPLQHATQTMREISSGYSFTGILLKCISSGINMIEEERTNEQGDDNNSQDVFIVSWSSDPVIDVEQPVLIFYGYRIVASQIKQSDLFSPPDCSKQ